MTYLYYAGNCEGKMRKITETKNIFKVLDIGHLENYHSNMLAWLLDVNGGHHIGSTYFRNLVSGPIQKKSQKEMEETVDMDWESFSVYREFPVENDEKKGFIDIFCISEEKKCVICIENKVESSEHSNQLQRYADFVEQEYCEKGYKALFMYFTPTGETPSDARWIKKNYRDLYDITSTAIGNIVDGKIRGIVEDYGDVLLSLFANTRDFKSCITEVNESIVAKDFSNLECAGITSMNTLYKDSSLTRFAPADTTGGYMNTTDLCYINIKMEDSQRKKGTLACVLTFTNHPKNLEEGSEFRKCFPNAGLNFRWYNAITIEEKFLNDGEKLRDFLMSNECQERLGAVVKSLLSKMKDEIKAKAL